jgi:hypothetical protein
VRAIAAAAEAEATRQRLGRHHCHRRRRRPPAVAAAPGRRRAHLGRDRPAKARTAALGRRESKVYEDMINQGRMSFLSAPALQGMLEGGVPIMVDGQCVGAVGVSGVKSSEDAQIARAGIASLGA